MVAVLGEKAMTKLSARMIAVVDAAFEEISTK